VLDECSNLTGEECSERAIESLELTKNTAR
jgi:hypothetical protein